MLRLPFLLQLPLLLCLQQGIARGDDEISYAGKLSTWQGHDRHDFDFKGARAIVVKPKASAPGRPWIWRARFFGHEPQADRALLDRGFHVAYCDVGGLYGSPKAVARWNAFYEYATAELELERLVALEGMSRGGLIIYNWAAENADRVSAIYADAPVCDFKSWPGGLGDGKGSPGDWKACLAAYDLDASKAGAFRGQPIDRLAALARAGVPLLHVVGAADDVVPVSENTAILAKRYRELGGAIQVISKEGIGHHPHSLKDPAPIVEHVLRGTELARQRVNVVTRGSLANSLLRFRDAKKGHVAFMGGSITEMNGYRPMVERILRERFPATEFQMTNAGISSTCSTTGAFRLYSDVISEGDVDLFFVEFAVNDDQDAAHAERECLRGMEGIVRRLRKANPRADIVIVHFVNPAILEATRAGKTPLTVAVHERVAKHYDVSTIQLPSELARRIALGTMTWKDYGGTHPGKAGNRLCAEMVRDLLSRAWAGEISGATAHAMPAPLDAHSYFGGRFLDSSAVTIEKGWRIEIPEWKKLAGGSRQRFVKEKLLCADKPGAVFEVRFSGDSLGAYVLAGPDAGALEVSVDGGRFRTVELYHRYSRGLHYPRTVMLATDLESGEHRVVVRSKESGSRRAARILKLCVNELGT